MAGVCNSLSVVIACWSPIYKMTDNFGSHQGGSRKCEENQCGKCLKSTTYSALLGGQKSGHLVHEMIL